MLQINDLASFHNLWRRDNYKRVMGVGKTETTSLRLCMVKLTFLHQILFQSTFPLFVQILKSIYCRYMYVLCFFHIGIKHGFSCINVHQVPRKVLKTEGQSQEFQHLSRDLANANALKNNA